MKHTEATPITDALGATFTSLQGTRKAFQAVMCSHLRIELDRANLIAALHWARQQLGKHTRPSPIDKALEESERRFNQTTK